MQDVLPYSRFSPLIIVVVHGLPWGKGLGKHAPVDFIVEYVQNGVYDFTNRVFSLSSAIKHVLNGVPLVVSKAHIGAKSELFFVHLAIR